MIIPKTNLVFQSNNRDRAGELGNKGSLLTKRSPKKNKKRTCVIQAIAHESPMQKHKHKLSHERNHKFVA